MMNIEQIDNVTLVRMIKEGRVDALVVYALKLMQNPLHHETGVKLLLFIFQQDKNQMARDALKQLGYIDHSIQLLSDTDLSIKFNDEDLLLLGIYTDMDGMIHFKKDSYAYQQYVFEAIEGGYALTHSLSILKCKKLRLPDFIDHIPILEIRESFFDLMNIQHLFCSRFAQTINLVRGKKRQGLGIVKNLYLSSQIEEIVMLDFYYDNYTIEKISFDCEPFDVASIFKSLNYPTKLDILFNQTYDCELLDSFTEKDEANKNLLRIKLSDKTNKDFSVHVSNNVPTEKISINQIIDDMITRLMESRINEILIDKTYTESYLIIDEKLSSVDVSLFASLMNKPQDFRLLNKEQKEDIDLVKLCSILAPSAFYHFPKKFKDSSIIMNFIVPFSKDLNNFDRSSVKDHETIRPLIELFHYQPKSRANNLFESENRDIRSNNRGFISADPMPDSQIENYNRLVKEAVIENPVLYIALKYYPKYFLKPLFTPSFERELQLVYEEAKEHTFYSLKREKGFDFYNFIGRKKGIKDFKKLLLSQTKSKSFGESLRRIEDESLLQELIVKCDLSHELEIIPLMFLQENIIPHVNLLPFFKQVLVNVVTTFFKQRREIRGLWDWEETYVCTLAFIVDNFEDVMLHKINVPLHQLNLLEKPSFELSSLYGG